MVHCETEYVYNVALAFQTDTTSVKLDINFGYRLFTHNRKGIAAWDPFNGG